MHAVFVREIQSNLVFHSIVAHHAPCNHPQCIERRKADTRLDFRAQYTDKKHEIELSVEIQSPSTLAVRDFIQDVLKFLYLDDILPEHVRLVGYDCDDHFYPLTIKNTKISLEQLDVANGCVLHFEPTPDAPPPKPCRSIIVGPDGEEKKDYEWYRAKTTLGMLIEFVVEQFSLQSVERERIHLMTIVNELEYYYYPDERLSIFHLHNGMFVHVQIIPPLAPKTVGENNDIHVRCVNEQNEFTFDIQNTKSIGDLRAEIEKRCEHRQVIDLKLYNESHDNLDSDDTGRILRMFGVKPGQTLSATFRLNTRNAQPSLVNTASAKPPSAPIRKPKPPKVNVICKFPSNNPETFQMPVTETVKDLIGKVKTRIHTQRLEISEIGSTDIKINLKKDEGRCLADLGFMNEHNIEVYLIDKSPVHSSIISKKSPSSPKPEKAKRPKNMPIGLENLGNSCYMNSALQCIAHVRPLTTFFFEGLKNAHMEDGEHTYDDCNPYDEVGEITGAYAELLWHICKCIGNNDDDYTFKPSRLKEKLGSKDSRFATDDQQDAQEFMTFFLDAIHEELKAKDRSHPSSIINDLFFGKLTSTITCTKCNKEESTTHPISFLSIPLNRQERKFWINFISKKGKDELVSVEVPISGRVENVVDEFSQSFGQPLLFYYVLVMVADGEVDLATPLSEVPTDEFVFMEQEERLRDTRPKPLKIPLKKSTLEDCLGDFFGQEQLEDGWICPQVKCKEKTLATKQLKLSIVPTVLIIQFKRFSHENGFHQKVETFVEYPIQGLDLNRCLPTLAESAVYDLSAVSTHMGSISGGHYIAYAQRSSGNKTEWYRFDDSCVSRVKPEDYKFEIVSRHAYLLFYVKRNTGTLV